MSRYQVKCITKTWDDARISHIGGDEWRHSEEDAIFNIKYNIHSYYVHKNGHDVDVIVSNRNGRDYLKTRSDGDTPDNLLSLPRC